jgi:hypothetical protein
MRRNTTAYCLVLYGNRTVLSLFVLNIQYRPTYFSIIPIPKLLPVCTVHCIRAPVTSATLHDWNQNSHRFKSCTSHPMRLCIHFSYDAQRPSYQNPQRRHVAVRLRNEERRSVFFGTLPVFQTSRSPSFPTPLTIVNFHIFSATYPFCSSTYFLTMMMIDHDAFLPAIVMTS